MVFPHPFNATTEGLVAYGGNLCVERLLLAYRFGIFPWYVQEPILWWFISPRCVVFPNKLVISKSMKRMCKKPAYKLSVNSSFEQVINMCARIKRKDQDRTWITSDMSRAYIDMHKLGFAHSIEVFKGKDLVGGLYGIALGKIFYGESMFSLEPNTSKLAFIYLCHLLIRNEFLLIDCQQETPHMKSLGAEMMNKEIFWTHIKKNLLENQKVDMNSPDVYTGDFLLTSFDS